MRQYEKIAYIHLVGILAFCEALYNLKHSTLTIFNSDL